MPLAGRALDREEIFTPGRQKSLSAVCTTHRWPQRRAVAEERSSLRMNGRGLRKDRPGFQPGQAARTYSVRRHAKPRHEAASRGDGRTVRNPCRLSATWGEVFGVL
jgi:hypothetical protein